MINKYIVTSEGGNFDRFAHDPTLRPFKTIFNRDSRDQVFGQSALKRRLKNMDKLKEILNRDGV